MALEGIDCSKCPIEKICPALKKHQEQYGKDLDLTICYDSEGNYLEQNNTKCPLYWILPKAETTLGQ